MRSSRRGSPTTFRWAAAARATIADGSARAAGSSRSRTRSRPITRCFARRFSAASSRSCPRTLRHGTDGRRDLRGRQGLRLTSRRRGPRVVAARRSRDGLRAAAAWNRPARPSTSTISRASSSSSPADRRRAPRLRAAGRRAAAPSRSRGERSAVGATGELALAGRVGELHPSIAEAWELRGARVVIAEIDVAGLAGGRRPYPSARTPSRHPAAERDLAVVVAEARPSGEVAAAIGAAAGSHLESLRLFDIYRGAPLAAEEKSLAFRLAFRAADRTLAEAEVDAAIEAITAALAADLGGRIRT